MISEELPLISIVTASLNAEASIERTIKSVLAQTYKNVEHIIIDGKSSDQTVAIIQNYRDRIAYFISEPDKGISDAFNKGIANARGYRICILGADDWLEPDAIEKIVANDAGEDVLHGKLRMWYSDGNSYIIQGSHLHLNKEQTVNFPSAFIKREAYLKWGGFNTNYKIAMDYDLLLRFMLHGASFKHINEVITNMGAGGASDKNWKAGVLEVKRAKDELKGKNFAHDLYAWKQINAIYCSKKLMASPLLSPIFNFYRKYFSMVRKVRV